MTTEITEQELVDARQIWGDALIAISKAFEEEGVNAARVVANGALDTAYGFELGPEEVREGHVLQPWCSGILSRGFFYSSPTSTSVNKLKKEKLLKIARVFLNFVKIVPKYQKNRNDFLTKN